MKLIRLFLVLLSKNKTKASSFSINIRSMGDILIKCINHRSFNVLLQFCQWADAFWHLNEKNTDENRCSVDWLADWLMLHTKILQPAPIDLDLAAIISHLSQNYLLMHFKDMNIHLTQSVLKMSIHFMKMAWDWTWYIIFGRYKYANISEARNTNAVNEWTRRLNVSQISARITDWSKCTLDSYANTTNTHTPQRNHIWCESAKHFFFLSFFKSLSQNSKTFRGIISAHNRQISRSKSDTYRIKIHLYILSI